MGPTTTGEPTAVPIRHIDAQTLAPDPSVPGRLKQQTIVLAADLAVRTGLPPPEVPIHWAEPEHFAMLTEADWYQSLHRPRRPPPTPPMGPAGLVTPEAPPGPSLGCPAAYLPRFGFVVAVRPRGDQPFSVAALAHALAEATLCSHYRDTLARLQRRCLEGALADLPDDLDDRQMRAVEKLSLMRATTLGLAQAALLARGEGLFTRSQMHRLWQVPLPTTVQATTVAYDPDMQRVVPWPPGARAYLVPSLPEVAFAPRPTYALTDPATPGESRSLTRPRNDA